MLFLRSLKFLILVYLLEVTAKLFIVSIISPVSLNLKQIDPTVFEHFISMKYPPLLHLI